MDARRHSSLRRQETDGQLSLTVRYDYSDTYFENEDLDADLGEHTDQLGKEKYKANIDSEENLQQAKKGADAMLSLKEAVRKREPNDSINKVAMTGEYKTHFTADHKHTDKFEKDYSKDTHTTTNTETEHNKNKVGVNNAPNFSNTLTMFLLSIQQLKRMKRQANETPHEKTPTEKREEQIQEAKKSNFMRHGECPLSSEKPRRKAGRRPATASVLRNTPKHVTNKVVSRAPSAPIYSMHPSEVIYGINVSRDLTRSRRQLENISKLEYDKTYGYVDRYEVRRRKLLEMSKDTKQIDERIKTFLKDIDAFKRSSCPANSLDRVLNKINTV